MKKKIILSVLAILLMMPVGYASFIAFYAPKIIYDNTFYRDDAEEYLRRYNYKPWSGGRPDTDMKAYSKETKEKFDRTKAAFDKSQEQYDTAFKAVDEAAKEFDKMTLSGY